MLGKLFHRGRRRRFRRANRTVTLGDRCAIAAHAFLHGPITLGDDVSINVHACLDGGRAGIVIGSGSRVAARVTIYAFDHGLSAEERIMDQPTTSRGVRLGEDVWVGAGAGITDGVHIGKHAVIGMGSVVTRDVADYAIGQARRLR